MNEKAGHYYRQKIDFKLRDYGVTLFGIADLKGFSTPLDDKGKSFPRAISFALLMNPEIMASIKNGPNQSYGDEFAKVNTRINEIIAAIESDIIKMGFKAKAVEFRSEEFPHKTAATRAGLGWIGRNDLLVTKGHGPWVRLGTIFTDMPLVNDKPVTKSYCGKCTNCVEACPADAIVGNSWHPGTNREELVDILRCDKWKKKHYYHIQKGQCCGICVAVCPFGK